MDHADRPPWGRPRRYVHFDSPLPDHKAKELVENPAKVATHAFWPLLGLTIRERRWRVVAREWRPKTRPIAYAAHADSCIFSYYAWGLSKLYEQCLMERGLGDCVLAYRSGRGLSNYDFAAEAFEQIIRRGECETICVDIERFFENIPHKLLKQQWKRLLGTKSLPDDHYSVFKAATRYSVVPLSQARLAANVGKRRLRRHQRLPLTPSQFRSRIVDAGLINRHTSDTGIPQGLPISGLLANLVLLDVDDAIQSECRAIGATYRRYSDDILIVTPRETTDRLADVLRAHLNDCGFNYADSKTERRRFCRDTNGVLVSHDYDRAIDGPRRPMQYLGFDFDGRRVMLRQPTLTRFSKRMKGAVKRARNSAAREARATGDLRIRRRELYAKFSHLKAHPETPPERRARGNFFMYARRAHDAIEAKRSDIEIESRIMAQLKRQWRHLDSMIVEAEKEIAAMQGNSARNESLEGSQASNE